LHVAGDITIDGSHTITNDSNGHLNINSASGKQIFIDAQGQLRLDSGGAQALTLSSSQDASFTGNVSLADSKNLKLGTGQDLELFHSGTESFISNATGDLTIQNSADDKDIIFRSDDGSGGTTEYFKLDGSQTIIDVATRTLFRDSVKATFGAGYDLVIYHDGSNSYVQQQGTGDLIIRNSADDKDIIFQSDDGSGGTTEYFRLNGDNSDVIFSKPIELEDSVELRIGGSGADLRFFHSTNSFMQNFVGDLQIEQHTNDKDIFLRCDDGSGGVTTYILLDGSEVATKIETVKIFMPNLPTSDPSVAGQLYNDSGTLKISAG
jgi:hypothetical protein